MVRPCNLLVLGCLLALACTDAFMPTMLYSVKPRHSRCVGPRMVLDTRPVASPSVAKPSEPFRGDFSKPGVIPEEGIAAAVEVMRSGRLFRYSTTSPEESHVAQVEEQFAELVQSKYAVGTNSCGSAIMIALKAVGAGPGVKVLTNGFTFTAVPSAIVRLNAEPVLVETEDGWTMDVDDLERVAEESGAKILCLSHMRGKVSDMDRIAEVCKKMGITLVEDCAHSTGVLWNGVPTGRHGKVACYSTQSAKVINTGEGGFVCTDDDEICANAIFLSGAYERTYKKHSLRPSDDIMERAMKAMPNLSCRMSEVTAAMMRPIIQQLPETIANWNRRYDMVVEILEKHVGEHLVVPKQDPRVEMVGDSLNFYLRDVKPEQAGAFMDKSAALGVPLQLFSSDINARYHHNWREWAGSHELPVTDDILRYSYDIKMPSHFSDEEYVQMANVIAYSLQEALKVK